MSKTVTGIQGQLLEVNVVGCRNLSDKEWFSRQDPYVVVEYANNRFRTRTDTDGGKNPTFNEKFQIPLIEGLREINVQVWNSNTVSLDDHIGSCKVLLDRVLSSGYDNTAWALKSKHGKTSGEVNLILHYAGSKKDNHGAAHGQTSSSGYPPQMSGYPPPPPAYGAPPAYPPAPAPYPSGYAPQPVSYQAPPQGYPPVNPYPAPPTAYPGPPAPYPAPTGYPAPSGYPAAGGYPPPPTGYPAPAPHYPAPVPYPAPGGYPQVMPYGAPGHKAGKVHVGSHSSYGSHGHYKHGKHKKYKGFKFGKKSKGWGKGWKGKKK
ncbi:hypothetical protein MPTK1_4g08810 [Marchantia polymorpha subsp. ruderalis]|nr:hypothetical protein MARPO_0188s0003 [Marchantia polymorpha]BBN08090.1 hypothetical protein Mp_4g08810 [Marchantia polymorpha subsp. ruderalis]|eukprot:PTQ27654.1 hypothetical protein MARPO_0188s0003 [Marchantia polymorpha]